MKKTPWLLLLSCLLTTGYAFPSKSVDNTQQSSVTYELNELKKWEHTEARGDLNRDGVEDLVIIATPDSAKNMMTTENGIELNLNQPILAIFKGTKDGRFINWKQYDDVIPPRIDEYISFQFSLDITSRGALSISVEIFASAGSWYNNDETFLFRFQENDFYLIGHEEESLKRNTGEVEKNSYNYLTHKKQYARYNIFDDSVKTIEKWSTLPKAPLRRLGSWTLMAEEI